MSMRTGTTALRAAFDALLLYGSAAVMGIGLGYVVLSCLRLWEGTVR